MVGDSSGCYEEGLVGDFGGPRPRRKIGGPSIASDHGGLSRSLTLAELALGDFKLIARFILFSLTNEAKHAEQMPAGIPAKCLGASHRNVLTREPANQAAVPAAALPRARGFRGGCRDRRVQRSTMADYSNSAGTEGSGWR